MMSMHNTPTRYSCMLCEDTGYRTWKQPENYPMSEVEFCSCDEGRRRVRDWDRILAGKNAAALTKLFEGAGIPSRFQGLTIDSLAAFKDREKAQAIAAARELAENGYIETDKGPMNGLVLSGMFGMGKTGLLTPVLRAALDSGKSGLWIEVYDFIDAIQNGYSDGSADTKLEAAMRADIILLDDLGDPSRKGAETDDKRSIMYRLINYRHGQGLPMLISTNLTGPELAQQFGPRTFERIIESCAWVTMGGVNLRMNV